MTEKLESLVQRYSIKYDRKLKRNCAPLKNHFDISIFTYYRIENDGNFIVLSNYPEELEYYYSQKLYLHNPYLVQPSLLRSGCVVISSTHDSAFQQYENDCYSKYDMMDPFLIIQKKENFVDGFFFANIKSHKNPVDFYSNSEPLKKFGNYFIQENQTLIDSMRKDGFNLLEEKGEAFLKRDPNELLSNHNPHIQSFLKEIDPLSKRERQCLELFKEGHSAQATGAILGLSQRTVEHYFEKIKDKLDCNSKWELLNK